MAVGVWDGAGAGPPSIARLREFADLVVALGERLDATSLADAIGPAGARELPDIMRLEPDQWSEALRDASDVELIALVRFFALVESAIDGCEAGKRSPAIAAARALRARKAYPTELTPWLRKHSTNRFLPYGSLLDLPRSAEKRP